MIVFEVDLMPTAVAVDCYYWMTGWTGPTAAHRVEHIDVR